MWYSFRILLLILSFSVTVPVLAQSVGAEVDRDVVKTGEVFTYTIRIEGQFTSPRIQTPDFGKLKVVGQSQSRNYRMSGGTKQVEAVFIYQLTAYESGEYVLPKAEVTDGKKTYSADTLTVQVTGEPVDIEHEKELDRFRQGAISL